MAVGAKQGYALLVVAPKGAARRGSQGSVWLGSAGQFAAVRGMAVMARHGPLRRGVARHVLARRGMAGMVVRYNGNTTTTLTN